MRKFLLDRKLVLVLTLWMAMIGISPSDAVAFPSESFSTIHSVSQREAQIEKVMSVFSRPEAQAHLRLMRIDEREVKEALAGLDDAQLTQVAQKAESVKAAGDGALGLVIALLLIVFLIVLIMSFSNKKVEIKDAK